MVVEQPTFGSHVVPEDAVYSVVIVPILNDNYMYLLLDKITKSCAVIDCYDASKALEESDEHGYNITHVFSTHGHWDHDRGNKELATLLGEKLTVVCSKESLVKAANKWVSDSDVVHFGNLNVRIIATPFHSPGHICFYVPSDDEKVPGSVFTGDAMLVAGCGRLNSGTKFDLHNAFTRLGNLPMNTLVWVGHERTVHNLEYAMSVFVGDEYISAKYLWAIGRRKDNLPTVPSTIDDEFKTSPFMKAAFGISEELDKLFNQESETEKGRIEQIFLTRLDKSSTRWRSKWRLVREAMVKKELFPIK